MSAAHSAVVIGDRDEVVHCPSVGRVDDVGRHVETVDGELGVGIQLVPPIAVVGEPLQADDQQCRQRPQVELLRSLLVFFTRWAVPDGRNHVDKELGEE